ncbi:MAG: hypothetical protein NZO58_02955 [Gemmataceae bacterium]|nr:hypothetical protein [Gemmataceae bacterium]
MKARILIPMVLIGGMLGLILAAAVHGGGPQVPEERLSPSKLRDDAVFQQQVLAQQFARFEQDLHKLILKLKRSSREEDRLRAQALERVLERAKTDLVSVKFEELITQLKEQQLKSTGELQTAAKRTAELANKLSELIALYKEDPFQSKLKDEIAKLKDIIKDLDKAIHDQKVTQGITDANKTDPNELKKIQNANTKQVAKILDKIAALEGKKTGDGKGDPNDPKGGAKEGGKAGDNKSGEAKDAGKQADKGSPKDAGSSPKDGTQVAKADPKAGGDPKQGGNKAGDPKDGGDPKQAGAKPGDPKGGDPKGGDSKGGDPKGGDPKGGDPKGGDPKGGDPKGGDPKGGDPKGGDAKPSPGDPKGSGDPKQGESKSGQQSSGQGESKPGGGQGEPKPDDSAQKPQPPQGPKDEIKTGKKKIEEGNYHQQSAEEKIAKKDNKQASKDQDDAVKNFEEAKKKLEELLRQLREEELERTLADLLRRCERMLAMQIAVYNNTKSLDALVQAAPDKQPTREHKADALRLSDNEGEIVAEARKAIEILESEGSAVAFPEVFQQVRDDMINVQRRLALADVGEVTQNIEQDIIDSLKEMIEALKKAQKDLKDKKSNPPPPGQPPPNADQKLLELIQELKLIRSMQIRVNTRTAAYGRMYQATEGEQTSNPVIRRELMQLSERQERIFEITNRLAKGDNK